MRLPTFESYCKNTTKGNALKFDFGPIRVWFSYTTPVAFMRDGDARPIVSENAWSRTTGKHLNAIDGGNKRSRLPREDFERALAAALSEEEVSR